MGLSVWIGIGGVAAGGNVATPASRKVGVPAAGGPLDGLDFAGWVRREEVPLVLAVVVPGGDAVAVGGLDKDRLAACGPADDGPGVGIGSDVVRGALSVSDGLPVREGDGSGMDHAVGVVGSVLALAVLAFLF